MAKRTNQTDQKRLPKKAWGIAELHPHCVICQNEGRHDLGERPHVYEGQE